MSYVILRESPIRRICDAPNKAESAPALLYMWDDTPPRHGECPHGYQQTPS
jgi:hypothetical protein